MKKTISKHEFCDEFKQWEGRKNTFSYGALKALYDWYEEVEEGSGVEIEMDVIAICCDWSEYDSAWEAMQQYQPDDMPTIEDTGVDENGHGMDLIEIQDAQEKASREWLEERTTVIDSESADFRVTPSIVVMNF